MLYNVLKRRAAVNLLKRLEQQDRVISGGAVSIEDARILADYGLIHLDEQEGVMVSISNKGKQFIHLLDQMKHVVEDREGRRVNLSFNLTEKERGVMVGISKNDGEVEERPLREALKKEQVVSSKKELASTLEPLQELGLVKIEKDLIRITQLGKRTLTSEVLESMGLR